MLQIVVHLMFSSFNENMFQSLRHVKCVTQIKHYQYTSRENIKSNFPYLTKYNRLSAQNQLSLRNPSSSHFSTKKYSFYFADQKPDVLIQDKT